MDDNTNLNQRSEYLIKTFEENDNHNYEKGIAVNPIASELASWYEKVRVAIENRDEEVILRSAIERILRRRLLLGGNGKSVAMSLVKELVWARYFPDESITIEKVREVEKVIDTYLELRRNVLLKHKLKEGEVNEWTYHLMSADIEDRLNPTIKKEAMISYIFHNLRNMIIIKDDTEEVRDVQTFIAIRKAYAKEDLAFLRYNLFNQYFGRLTEENLLETIDKFSIGKNEIERQLNYKSRFKIFEYVKRQIPPFLILEDVLRKNQGHAKELVTVDDDLTQKIRESASEKYADISGKVRRAIIRSIIFIFLSKVFLALTIEGTYERIVYGEILWHIIAINIAIPVGLMILMAFFIRAPGHDNTERIVNRIKSLLFDHTAQLGRELSFRHKPKSQTALDTVFSMIWISTYVISFGLIVGVLSRLGFNFVSQLFFIFFFAIVSFLSYRINQTAKLYTVKEKSGILTPFVDFFFMPIARVGRYLAEGVQSINIFIFLLDLVIETPLKGLIAFFERWFFFMHSKREDLA